MITLLTRGWPRLAVIAACWLVVRCAVVAGGLVLQAVFDRLADDAAGLSVWTLLAVLAAAYLAQTVIWCNLIMGRLEIPYTARIESRARGNLLSALLSRPAATALRQPVGDVTSRFTRDVEEVRTLPIWLAGSLARLIGALVMLVIMFRISPIVTVGVVLPFILVLWLARLMDPRVARYRTESRRAAAKVSELIGESMRAAATVATLGNQRHVTARMRRLGQEREQVTVRDRTFGEFQATLSMQAADLSAGLVMVLAAHQLSSGDLTVGDMALFVYYSKMVGEVVSLAGGAIQRFRQTHVSVTRLVEVAEPDDPLAAAPTYLDRPIPEPPLVRPGTERFQSLRVAGLTATYRDGSGIDDLDLELRPGTLTVLTGPVGGGKTTALRAVLGLLPSLRGTIEWNGVQVVQPHRFLVAPRVAYVPQVPKLFTGTIADNIRLGADGDPHAAAREAMLVDDLAELPDGLDTVVGVGGKRLSGGQAQRVALARALIRRPCVLVVDDVDSALDAVTARRLWERLLSDDGRAILAVSHNPYVLNRADTVIRMTR